MRVVYIMNQLDTFRFPFLGSREDGEPFGYLLLDVNQERANVAVYNWMVNRTNLDLQEKVNLFIPSLLTPTYYFRENTPGIVESIKKEEDQTYFYQVAFTHETSLDFSAKSPKELAQNISSESSLVELLVQLIKDSLILKRGVLVYLKHLAPYFSRIVDYSKPDYQPLGNFIFDDLRNRIKGNEESLQRLYLAIKGIKNPLDIPIELNLEDLRENVESEISLDLFLMAFANIDSRDELLQLLKESKYQEKLKARYLYMNYLISIKDLEKRLYSNYNQIVLIYLKALT